MITNQPIKNMLEKITNTHIFRILPRGIDIYYDISHFLPSFHPNVIFDIGANVGQSTMKLLRVFPKSEIYCFEPVKDTYRQLIKNVNMYRQVHCYQFALGDVKRKARMVSIGPSPLAFLLDHLQKGRVTGADSQEPTDVNTIDDICRKIKINRVNYLKVDTEGGDLNVLKGAKKMLCEHRIDLIEVEAGMNCKNNTHVSLEGLKTFLELKKYFLFGIYEQIGEWPSNEPHLRRANAAFISDHVISANKL